jgi:hypothetical protein
MPPTRAARTPRSLQVEVKLRLPDAAAHAKVASLLAASRQAVHDQENYFFDGANQELGQRRVVGCCAGLDLGWHACCPRASRWGNDDAGLILLQWIIAGHSGERPWGASRPPWATPHRLAEASPRPAPRPCRKVLRLRFYNGDKKAVLTLKVRRARREAGSTQQAARVHTGRAGRAHCCRRRRPCRRLQHRRRCSHLPSAAPAPRPLPPGARVQGKQILQDGIGRASEVEEPVDPGASRAFLQQPSGLLDLPLDMVQGLKKWAARARTHCLQACLHAWLARLHRLRRRLSCELAGGAAQPTAPAAGRRPLTPRPRLLRAGRTACSSWCAWAASRTSGRSSAGAGTRWSWTRPSTSGARCTRSSARR